jgi:hypothetical protein
VSEGQKAQLDFNCSLRVANPRHLEDQTIASRAFFEFVMLWPPSTFGFLSSLFDYLKPSNRLIDASTVYVEDKTDPLLLFCE